MSNSQQRSWGVWVATGVLSAVFIGLLALWASLTPRVFAEDVPATTNANDTIPNQQTNTATGENVGVFSCGSGLDLTVRQPLGDGINSGLVFDGVSPGCYNAGFCGQCDVLVVIKNLVEAGFLIVGSVAALIIVVAGIMILVSRGNAGLVGQAKKMIGTTVIGLVISFLAWTIVGTVATIAAGNPGLPIGEVTCQDVPAVALCSLTSGTAINLEDGSIFVPGATDFSWVSGGGGRVGAALQWGAGTGRIEACEINQIPENMPFFSGTRSGVRPVIGADDVIVSFNQKGGPRAGALEPTLTNWKRAYQSFNKAGARYGIDPFYLMAIAYTESRLGANVGPSVTGAYGLMQIQPSTFRTIMERSGNTNVPAACLREHSRAREAGYTYNRLTADGYCRNFTNSSRAGFGKGSRQPDPTCPGSVSGRSLIEVYAESCADWIREHQDEFIDAGAKYLDYLRDRDTGSLFDAACRYNAGGQGPCPATTKTGEPYGGYHYASDVELYQRAFCAYAKGLQTGSIAEDGQVIDTSSQGVDVTKAYYFGDSLTVGYGSELQRQGKGTHKGVTGERSTQVSDRLQTFLRTSDAQSASAIVIMYGTNDFASAIGSNRSQQAVADALVEQLNADIRIVKRTGIPVYVATIPDWGGYIGAQYAIRMNRSESEGRAYQAQSSSAINSYNQSIKQLGQAGSISGVIDMTTILNPVPYSTADAHPGRQYGQMGDLVISVLSQSSN